MDITNTVALQTLGTAESTATVIDEDLGGETCKSANCDVW